MPYAWSSGLETGNAAIDNQHRELFDVLNALYQARKSGKGQQEVKKTMEFMVAYTSEHFADEEQLQEKYNYPEYHAHKGIHDEFKRMVQKLAEGLPEDDALTDEFIAKVYAFVGEWLLNHIGGDDFKMAAYVRSRERRI